MKFKLILPAILSLIMLQLVPQAAWSQCGWHSGYGYGGYPSPYQQRRIWRAEHQAWRNYNYPPAYNPGYGYYRGGGGLLGGVYRAIF